MRSARSCMSPFCKNSKCHQICRAPTLMWLMLCLRGCASSEYLFRTKLVLQHAETHSSFALIPQHREAWAPEAWAPFPCMTHSLGVTEGTTISAWSRDNSPLTSVPDESAGDPEEHVSTVGTAVPLPTRSSQTLMHLSLL